MKTKGWAIGMMIACTLLTSTAQVLYKIGADKLEYTFASLFSNWQLFLGIGLYAIGAALVIIALRGGNVTTLYPIVTSSYIWVALGSIYFFKEHISAIRWIGIILIVAGIIVIATGEEKELLEFTEPI